jgi:hypothetical protein
MSGLHTTGRFVEGSGLLGYDAVSLYEWLLFFQSITVPHLEHHCLTLKMKALCFFEMSGTNSHPRSVASSVTPV